MAHATLDVLASSQSRNDEVRAGYLEAMQPVVEAGTAAGHQEDDIYASLQPIRRDTEIAMLKVDGVDFLSTRAQVGFYGDTAASRGGLEATAQAGPYKIGTKATAMAFKHMLLGTGNIGGKGGIVISDQQWKDLGADGRAELFRQHGLVHQLDPLFNITATDIRTSAVDMDAIVTGLVDEFGNIAPAAASGVSEAWGGRPAIQSMRTGLGGALVLEEYLTSMATSGDQRIKSALEENHPLPVIVQGLGKAGTHYIQNPPSGTVLTRVMERNGGIISEHPLDPQAVLKQSRENGLDESSQTALGGQWIPASELHTFWRSDEPCIVVPAFDKDQYTVEDAAAAADGTIILSLANSPVTLNAQKVLAERGIHEIVGHLANSGGTLSSRLLWESWFDPNWTPDSYDAAWHNRMREVSRSVFSKLVDLQLERDNFVPVAKVVDTIVADRAVERARRARAL